MTTTQSTSMATEEFGHEELAYTSDSLATNDARGVSRPCTHCGLTTPIPANTPDGQPVFCCNGCRGAYELIHNWGLADFYSLRDSMTIAGAPQAAGVQANYDQFDSPEFLGHSVPQWLPAGAMSAELGVHGLHCAACAWLIERALQRHDGVMASRVRMSDHTLRVHFDPAKTKLSEIAAALDRLGYRLSPLNLSRDKHLQVENRRLLIQVAIAGFLAANAMWIAIALYAGQYTGVAIEHKYFLGLVGIVLGTAAVLGPGRTFFVGALAALRTRTPHMDMPIALGLSAGTVIGLWHAITGVGQIYFDCLATLVFLLLIGRWIQFRQQHRAAKAVELMLRITPRHADLLDEGGQTARILVDRLRPGDRILVAAGDSIPADGQIVSGSSSINRSLLTGESQPVSVDAGDRVDAGTINIGSPLVIRVTAVGQESRIGKVMQSVELAVAQRTPIVQLADRIGGGFVVVVLFLAAITFFRWLPTSLHDATNYATALLIVACPCALALATPLAIAVAIGRAARAQTLVRDGQALLQLAQPGMLWFDKTGTLTEGKMRTSLIWGDHHSLALAAAVERLCQHPIAQSIVAAAKSYSPQLLNDATDLKHETNGICGRVENRFVQIGNLAYFRDQGMAIAVEIQRMADGLLSHGNTPILIAVDAVVTGLLAIADPIRANAAGMIAQARRSGWNVGMLSGDHPEIARRVGAKVGIDPEMCFGGVTPEEKLAAIKQSRTEYPTVVMVGDGANDAAALAAADVGIAVRGGAEVSLLAAPIFMSSNRLSDLIRLLKGSRTTRRVIYLNFAVSFAYNMATVYSAWVGWISPLMAAILMPLSSATVLGLTFLIPSFSEPSPNDDRAYEPVESLAATGPVGVSRI